MSTKPSTKLCSKFKTKLKAALDLYTPPKNQFRLPPNLICKKRSERIAGGYFAVEGVWRWIAYMRMGGELCGGSIIDEYTILTAGHCCENKIPERIFIQVGVTNSKHPEPTKASRITFLLF